MIGWDAADWRVATPLLEAGEMPHLQSMIESGVKGNMATLEPVLSPMGDSKPHIDLILACGLVLKGLGVAGGNVVTTGLCTHCHPELFYSYRRDGRLTGSQMMWVRLR